MSALEEKIDALVELQRATLDELKKMRRGESSARGRAHSVSELYTLRRAARALGVAITTLYVLIEDGRIKTVPYPGGRRRVPRDEVERVKREGLRISAAAGTSKAARRSRRAPSTRKVDAPPETDGKKVAAAVHAIDLRAIAAQGRS